MEENLSGNESINLDEIDNEEDPTAEELFPQLDEQQKGELLFCVQSLGCQTRVGNVTTYVKDQNCVDYVKELYKQVKSDNPDSTLKRIELGNWNIVESDLLKLLVSYPEDRNLAYFLVILLVTLTEKPEKENPHKMKYIQILQDYKLAFVTTTDAIKVLVQHIAECLGKDSSQRNEKHNQMLELIVYLIRNLLAIPDRRRQGVRGNSGVSVFDAKEDHMKDLHSSFLHKLSDETILEAIVYMCQDFTTPTMNKLNLCLLEIFYHIFRTFSPTDLRISTADYLRAIAEQERQTMRRMRNELPSRHSKFGSNYSRPRMFNGNSIIYHNPFQKNIDESHVPNQRHRVKPKRHENLRIPANYTTKPNSDLCEKIKRFADDLLVHCFNPLLCSVFPEFYKDTDRLEDDDRCYLFYFQSFMLEFMRSGENRDIGVIAEALKVSNFEYLYRCLAAEMRKTSAKTLIAKEFQAAMKFFTQLLYIIQEMSNSEDETTKRNATILKQNIFYHEVSKVCRHAFLYWVAGFSPKSFLDEIVEFIDIVYTMLKDYSKGKLLTIRTERLSRRAGEEGQESTYQERQFSYAIEFSILIDYDVITKYCFLLKSVKQNSQRLNDMVARFFQRVIDDCKADWVFFQADYLSVFESVLNAGIDGLLPTVITNIVSSFFELMKTNKLLVVESLFRIRDKDTKNAILTNYDFMPETQELPVEGDTADQITAEADEDEPMSRSFQVKKWTLMEDKILLEQYFIFASMENVYEIVSTYLPQKNAKQVKKRLTVLKVHRGQAKAKQMVEQMHFDEHHYEIRFTAPKAFEALGQETVANYLRKISDEVKEYRTMTMTEDMPIVPVSEDEFSILATKEFQDLMIGLGFRTPYEGETYFRVPATINAPEIYNWIDKFAVEQDEDPVELSEEEETYEMGKIMFKPVEQPAVEQTGEIREGQDENNLGEAGDHVKEIEVVNTEAMTSEDLKPELPANNLTANVH